jgi:P-type Mg2+ transporter
VRPIDKIIPKTHTSDLRSFWTLTPEHIYAAHHCGSGGLNAQDAEFRPAQYGPNSDAEGKNDSLVARGVPTVTRAPVIDLLAAGVISVATGDAIGGSIIVAILAISVGLDTIQEGHAVRAAEALRCSVALKAEVKRSGTFREIFVDKIVPGDILRVRAGDIIPADALILESTAFTAGEAALTGEPYPVEKLCAAPPSWGRHPQTFTGAAIDDYVDQCARCACFSRAPTLRERSSAAH